MKKNILFVLILVVIILGGAFVVWNNRQSAQPNPSPSSSAIAPTPSPSGADITQFTKPASCQLSGSIDFLQKNIFRSNDALFRYQGIDNEARLITWTVSPTDEFSIGPNIFANLDIPDGSRSLTISLPAEPKARQYTLTARISYGRWVNNTVVVKEARCSGSIPVYLRY
ncbi:MAG: hypothetical protein AAB420_03795 [Patescibacteria group bacterium]